MPVNVYELYPPYPYITVKNYNKVVIEWFGCLDELQRKGIDCQMYVYLREANDNNWEQIYS